MKKIVLMMAMACAVTAVSAQENSSDLRYRRSSLYTIMVPSDKLTGEAEKIVTATFDTMPIPNKYNNRNLKVRHIDLTKIEVTDEEIKAAEEVRGSQKKGLAGLAKKGLNLAKKATTSSETGGMGADEKVAKIIKYFKENHVANQIIGEWFNKNSKMVDGSHFNTKTIDRLGVFGVTQEELDKAKMTNLGLGVLKRAAAVDLLSKTFVMVTSYAYQSAEEVAEMASAAGAASSALGAGAVGAYASLGASVAGKFLKGYFITTTSYLFQLKWDNDIMKDFMKYWEESDISAFDLDDAYELEYVGKTSNFAPATLKLTTKGDELAGKLISRATERATDASIARLQRKFDQFKTFSVLNVTDDGSTMYAYIGKKEGLKSGDKFDVIQPVYDETTGIVTEKKVGSIKVAKGKVWDNRAGAGEIIEGAASEKEEEDIDKSLTYTVFEGTPKKEWAMGGLLLKQSN